MVEEAKASIASMINALWANSFFDEFGAETSEARLKNISSLNEHLNSITEYIYEGTGPLSEQQKPDEEVFDSPFFKNHLNKTKASAKINYNNTSSFQDKVYDVED